MAKCIVKGCPNSCRNNGRGPRVTLHGFPNTLDKVKLWLQQIDKDLKDLDTFAQRIMKAKKRNMFRICSVHFSPQSYVWEGKKLVLQKDAFPTIFHRGKCKAAPKSGSSVPPVKRVKVETSPNREEKARLTQWRRCPKTKTLVMEKGHNTSKGMEETGACANPIHSGQHSYSATAKKMVDASTSMDRSLFLTDKAAQWPEYELNYEGESWKVKHDHFYPFVLHTADMPMRETEKYPRHLLETQKSAAMVHHNKRSDSENTLITQEMRRLHNLPNNAAAAALVPTGKFKPPERDMAAERKFIVFESCLDNLFYRLACQVGDGCRAPIVQLEKNIDGTFLSVNGLCHNGHRFHLWSSQPFVKHVAAGNLLSASAILFSGLSFSAVQEMNQLMGLQQISSSTYSEYEQSFLFPAVDLHWQQECQRLKETLKDVQLTVSGSSQHGGASLSAKHCTYIFFDVATKRVLDFHIETLLPNTSRIGIERKAFRTSLSRLLSEKFDIRTVVTDSHHGIKKEMREKFLNLQHRYDTWKYAKSLCSHLRAASRKKACSGVAHWIPSITNHLFRSLCESNGNVHILRDHWRSILPHIVGNCSQACSRKPRNRKEACLHPIIKGHSPAFQKLRELVLSSRVTKDLALMSPVYNQGETEVCGNFIVKYRPKRTRYKTDSLEARTKLAILAYNANVHRRHIKYRSVKRGCMSALPFFTKSLHCRFTKADQAAMRKQVVEMIRDVLKVCAGHERHR
ncbi:uncharacterized protein LOC130282613 [Hyla sarda]|uniref:uncharacterized protein LOC130282613 n=1 Tax=Hyla sarda TaxID=327740 RepID=UPI0024C2EE9F|nr:uncharacterized protein LOC130282613 [Hyla sarda]